MCEIAGFGPVAVSAVLDMIDTDDPFLTAVVTRGEKVVGVAHLGRRPNASSRRPCSGSTRAAPTSPAVPRPVSTTTIASTGRRTHFTVLDLLDRLCGHCHALKTRDNWSLVEGRGKRALVPPEDPRHPRNAMGPPRPPPARC